MGRRVLVTGAAGFVGAVLARRLLADGHEATLLVRPGSNCWRLEELRTDARIIEVDLPDRDAVAAVVRDCAPEWVFHLAAHGAYSWQKDLATITAVNVLGTQNVVEAAVAAGAAAVVNAGTSSEYGYRDHPPSEDELPDPNSAYAAAKTAATTYCRWVARHREQPITTLRLYAIYGPWEASRRLIPTLVAEALHGALPPLAAPEISRDFVYVEDACDAFVRAAERARAGDGAIYNVASGRQTTLRDLVAVARAALSVEAEPAWGAFPARDWDTTTWVGDPRRAQRELQWSARVELAEGLAATASWLQRDSALLPRYRAERR